MPDGKVWIDDMHAAFQRARDAAKTSGSDVVNVYPPRSSRIMQWTLLTPVPLSGLWRLVTHALPFDPM